MLPKNYNKLEPCHKMKVVCQLAPDATYTVCYDDASHGFADLPEELRTILERASVFKFKCCKCKEWIIHAIPNSFGGTGYATLSNRRKICYNCCALVEMDDMRKLVMDVDAGMKGVHRYCLYLTTYAEPQVAPHQHPVYGHISNWTGKIKIPIRHRPRTGSHNMAGRCYHVWFQFEGREWHGVQYGGNTQIVRCLPIKKRG